MTIDSAGSAEGKSSEPEVGGHIHKLERVGEAFRQAEISDGDMPAESLGTLLRRLSNASIGEIEILVADLRTLRRKLQTDGDRIQRDIEAYAGLSQQVMKLTTIITDSVKKLPGSPGGRH
jgi:hypothetical protein